MLSVDLIGIIIVAVCYAVQARRWLGKCGIDGDCDKKI